jgi:hypothetical protein
MAAGAFAGIAVSSLGKQNIFLELNKLTKSQEHTIVYPIDAIKVCNSSQTW